ncbi:hypothetical protein T492DRAFT_1040293 [Pavlovales sp. CCMP2436]|nr:hypothetical protein T492DRAFT_1040293 [Pavlovales sp. CCMP2436]|mmetsp:Transcript_5950/g.15578  ORF Transcript_5950/g.15578 Transcript_5950/m.15578 type:complete len:209 (+) Transcript_5950:77-703(+)
MLNRSSSELFLSSSSVSSAHCHSPMRAVTETSWSAKGVVVATPFRPQPATSRASSCPGRPHRAHAVAAECGRATCRACVRVSRAATAPGRAFRQRAPPRETPVAARSPRAAAASSGRPPCMSSSSPAPTAACARADRRARARARVACRSQRAATPPAPPRQARRARRATRSRAPRAPRCAAAQADARPDACRAGPSRPAAARWQAARG